MDFPGSKEENYLFFSPSVIGQTKAAFVGPVSRTSLKGRASRRAMSQDFSESLKEKTN